MDRKLASTKKKNRTDNQILLGQYFTPQSIADFMVSMFRKTVSPSVKILDPGAGEGVLGRTLANALVDKDVSSTFIELDKKTFETLSSNARNLKIDNVKLVNEDFITAAFSLESSNEVYSHIILNPPYFKLSVDSDSSRLLRTVGIKVTNIYAAFMWLSARLLDDNGELVAIIPRSFCNGPYFEAFRQYITGGFSINQIHLFSSRDKAFSDDKVLQENIIISISKNSQGKLVKISTSSDNTFQDVDSQMVSVEKVLIPGDKSRVIHIPEINQGHSLTDYVTGSLKDLGLVASTGPVVDFRSKMSIKASPSKNTVPLLYPSHISGNKVHWPIDNFKKLGQYYEPALSKQTLLDIKELKKNDRAILPLDGFYVIVRRFSSKEEKRRIFAAIVDPSAINSPQVTFENHLNFFHVNKHGFSKSLAYGLCAYLNSSLLDTYFRQFSGHTQVNVTDLKNLPYPSEEALMRLGDAQESIDGLMDDIVSKEILGKIV